MIGDLGNVDQSIGAGDHLGKGAEGHQADYRHGGGVAYLVFAAENVPGIVASVL